MRQFIIMLSMVALFCCSIYAKDRAIEFKNDNYFAITTTFTEGLLEEFTKKILSYSGDELIIYFDSPGGSVFAMSRMLGIMKSSKTKFICVARFAASAAFMTFQGCHERYLLNDGILMSHNAAGSFRGEFPRVQTLYTVMNSIVERLEIEVSKRLKLTYEEYKKLINNNFWMDITIAKKYNAIDGIGTATCSKMLVETEVERVIVSCSWFGCSSTRYIFSGCPLLKVPIKKAKEKDKDKAEWEINTNIKNYMWIYHEKQI